LEVDNWSCVVHAPPARYGLAAFLLPVLPEKAYLKMSVRLYVGNLAKSTTEDELKALFAKAGAVEAVEVIKDRDSGQSKGFAFITMTDQAEADKAIGMFNAYSLSDRELKVNVAKPKA
jgi:RNA recognition motif-containing protein